MISKRVSIVFNPRAAAVRAMECKQQEQMCAGCFVLGESSGREGAAFNESESRVPRGYYLCVT